MSGVLFCVSVFAVVGYCVAYLSALNRRQNAIRRIEKNLELISEITQNIENQLALEQASSDVSK